MGVYNAAVVSIQSISVRLSYPTSSQWKYALIHLLAMNPSELAYTLPHTIENRLARVCNLLGDVQQEVMVDLRLDRIARIDECLALFLPTLLFAKLDELSGHHLGHVRALGANLLDALHQLWGKINFSQKADASKAYVIELVHLHH